MNQRKLVLGIAVVCLLWLATARAERSAVQEAPFQDQFALDKCKFSANGSNFYFVLEPGHKIVLTGQEAGKAVRLTIAVLNQTKMVAGVETRVVEERESKAGELVEISKNYFAMCGPANDIYYFGKTVDVYKAGRVIGHAGSWEAGVGGARPGLMMPGAPIVGMRFFQELAPSIAMDRAEIMSLTEKLKTAMGDLEDILKVEETSPLDAGTKEYKYYAPGIGLVKDGKYQVVECQSGVR